MLLRPQLFGRSIEFSGAYAASQGLNGRLSSLALSQPPHGPEAADGPDGGEGSGAKGGPTSALPPSRWRLPFGNFGMGVSIPVPTISVPAPTNHATENYAPTNHATENYASNSASSADVAEDTRISPGNIDHHPAGATSRTPPPLRLRPFAPSPRLLRLIGPP
eukprot:1177911-Prorocentrum_minimum.AAC.2